MDSDQDIPNSMQTCNIIEKFSEAVAIIPIPGPEISGQLS
jgi:hypothetical protein